MRYGALKVCVEQCSCAAQRRAEEGSSNSGGRCTRGGISRVAPVSMRRTGGTVDVGGHLDSVGSSLSDAACPSMGTASASSSSSVRHLGEEQPAATVVEGERFFSLARYAVTPCFFEGADLSSSRNPKK